nr:MAG: hypothetical protein [Microvirus sp.]
MKSNLKFYCEGCALYCTCPTNDLYPGGCTDFFPKTEIQDPPQKGHLKARGDTQLKIDI